MEFSGESISTRVARLNAEIVGKSSKKACSILTREGLLDSLQALYDECCIENLQKTDKNIEFFCGILQKYDVKFASDASKQI